MAGDDAGAPEPGEENGPSFDDLPIGNSYVDWVLDSGTGAVRQLLADPASNHVRTPVLIAFNASPDKSGWVTVEDIDRGNLAFSTRSEPSAPVEDARGPTMQQIWAAGFSIPDSFLVFNDMTKRLQRRPASPGSIEVDDFGLVEEVGLVMAFASDAGLKLWHDEVANGSPLRKQIVDIFAGPPLDPLDRASPFGTGKPWHKVSQNIRARYDETKTEIDSCLRYDPSARPNPVFTAVIDDGIAFANGRFRAGQRSAFHYLWLQTEPGGRDFRRRQINNMLSRATVDDAVDEDALYRNEGIVSYASPNRHTLGFPATHGTPVLDIACGAPPRNAEDLHARHLMAVELPTGAVRDTSLSRLHPFIFAGIVYLLARSVNAVFKLRAGAGMEKMTLRPMAVNISFGNTAGPHDGLSPFEIAVDTLARRWSEIAAPLRIVFPSGNSHLARGHARGNLGAPATGRGTLVLPWRVLPDDRTDSAVEIWLPRYGARPAERVRVKVVPPGVPYAAVGTGWVKELSGETGRLTDAAGRTILELSYRLARHWNHYTAAWVARGVFSIHLAPTDSLDASPDGSPAIAVAPSGLWSIIVERLRGRGDLEIAAWLQRDDTPFTYRRLGRQSYFDATCAGRFDEAGRPHDFDETDCVVRRRGSMSAIATGYEPVVVAGLTARRVAECHLEPSRYSAGGPTDTAPSTLSGDAPPERTGADVSAMSDETAIHRGMMAAGTMGGSVGVFTGTSMAAPQVTRLLVEFAERTGDLPDRKRIVGEADPFPPDYRWPNTRVGAGSLIVRRYYPARIDWETPGCFEP